MTVGSLAISATRRPSIVAMPVTTPSAPSPSSSQFASSALLGEGAGVDQALDPLAHRQLALLGGLLVVALRAAGEGGLEGLGEVGHGSLRRHCPDGRLFGRRHAMPVDRARRAARGRRAGGRAPPARRARPRPGAAGRSRSRPPSRAASRPRPRWRRCRSSPGGTGQPPSSPKLASKESTPSSSAASTLASPWPRVLWKWAVSSTPAGSRSRAAAKNSRDLARVGHPGRVAEADLLAAGRGEPLGDPEDALGRDLALVGAAEGGRDHPLAAQPGLARGRQRPLQPAQRLLDRAVDVLAVVGLRGGEEDADLVEAVAQRQRPLEAALVGDQDREGDAVAALDRRPAPARRRRAAGSRRGARTRSPRAAAGRSRRACRSAAPCRRSRSSPARSGSRRGGRPRGCGRSSAARPSTGSLGAAGRGSAQAAPATSRRPADRTQGLDARSRARSRSARG